MKKKNNNWKKAFIPLTILSLGAVATACTICLLKSCNSSSSKSTLEAKVVSSVKAYEKIMSSDIIVNVVTPSGAIIQKNLKWNEDYTIAVKKGETITPITDFGTNGYALETTTTTFVITYIKDPKVTTTLTVSPVGQATPINISVSSKTTLTWTNSGLESNSLKYSTDNGSTWKDLTSGVGITIGESSSQTILLKGNLLNYHDPDAEWEWEADHYNYITFTKENDVKASVILSGSIMSLVNNGEPIDKLDENHYLPTYSLFSESTALYKIDESKTKFLPLTNLSTFNCEYGYMFYGCTSLINAPKLPATILAKNCYVSMFYGCTSLTTAPELPATTLTDYCYSAMFLGCTSLLNAPKLPATNLAQYCYEWMFTECTSLTTAPELPATNLANYCYRLMFYGCTSLVNLYKLPATTLVEGCYNYMFDGCTSLTTTPELPATTLAKLCYSYMFCGCTSLETVSSNMLPATILQSNCYNNMFGGCTSLTNTPKLPATTLADGCYMFMFDGCTSLKTVSSDLLPITTLQQHCYENMFSNCTSLTTAPELPATTLAKYCYNAMFRNCSSLITPPTKLPALTVEYESYAHMFDNCISLKIAPKFSPTTLAELSCISMFNGCSKLKINNTGSTGIKFFTCPSSLGKRCVENMLTGTGGSCTSVVANGEYYYE